MQFLSRLNPDELEAEAAAKRNRVIQDRENRKKLDARRSEREEQQDQRQRRAPEHDYRHEHDNDDDEEDEDDGDDGASDSDSEREEREEFEKPRSIDDWNQRGDVPTNRLPVRSETGRLVDVHDDEDDNGLPRIKLEDHAEDNDYSDEDDDANADGEQDGDVYDSGDDEHAAEDLGHEPEPERKAEAAVLTAAQQYQLIIRRKEKIAKLASGVLENPEENLSMLLELIKLAEESNPISQRQRHHIELQATVFQYSMLSIMAVFKDIIPGFVHSPPHWLALARSLSLLSTDLIGMQQLSNYKD